MVTESLKKNKYIYLLTKYIKRVRWGVAECLSYIWDAWCLKVKFLFLPVQMQCALCLHVLLCVTLISLLNIYTWWFTV